MAALRPLHVCLLAVTVAAALVLPGCPKTAPPATSPPTAQAPPPASPTTQPAKTITVFAGAASKPALTDLGPMYEARAGAKVAITFGGSGAVLTQFAQEQYGDVYIPGSDDFMDRAEKKGAVVKDTRTVLVYLVPTICVAKGNPKKVHELKDLARGDLRVVIGQPKSVCLGDIAESALTDAGLWDKVKPHIASYASSCEDTVNNLLLGEADVIIGWDVFARQHPDKVESIPLSGRAARPRNIPASVIQWSKQPEEAKALIKFLASAEAQEVFSRHGYTLKPLKPPA